MGVSLGFSLLSLAIRNEAIKLSLLFTSSSIPLEDPKPVPTICSSSNFLFKSVMSPIVNLPNISCASPSRTIFFEEKNLFTGPSLLPELIILLYISSSNIPVFVWLNTPAALSLCS